MILFRRTSLIAVLAASLTVAGCSTVSRLNPFGGGDDEPQEVASEGERIPIVGAESGVEVTEAIAGQDFNLPAPTPRADWPLPGGAPEQAVEHVDAGQGLSVAWRQRFGEGSERGKHVTAPPIVADGKVFVMDGTANVSARDAQSGREIWRTELRSTNRRDREAFGGGLAYADGKVYVTSGYRLVVQLDAATGAVGWRRETEQPVHGAPTIAGGRVMAVSIDNTLLTFDAATGEPSWTYQALTEPARILAASSPAVSGDTVVAAFGSGELVALRVANGNDLWAEALSRASRTTALSEIRDIPGRPVIYQGDVYAVSHSGVFAAVDLRTGTARWTLPVTGITTPWPAGDVVYVVSKAGEVICVNRDSGQVYWIRNLNEGIEQDAGGGGFFGFFERRGNVRPIWSSPLLASNRLVLVSSGGRLVALNPKTGAVEHSMNIGSPAMLAPIAAGGTVYVVTDEAELIALR
ncbi:PQQ-binding-like beta-propeller repeat protein [Phenylobacterium terrae]|uniref:PQQ-binding-like beta-propeller repeat protein n=1 Tax=Phenylobacterium terrae TaxID=2665495 RepID=A0ABW4N5J4_9CAUL